MVTLKSSERFAATMDADAVRIIPTRGTREIVIFLWNRAEQKEKRCHYVSIVIANGLLLFPNWSAPPQVK